MRVVRLSLNTGGSTVATVDRAAFDAVAWQPEDAGVGLAAAGDYHPPGCSTVTLPPGTVLMRYEPENTAEARRLDRRTRYELPDGRAVTWWPGEPRGFLRPAPDRRYGTRGRGRLKMHS